MSDTENHETVEESNEAKEPDADDQHSDNGVVAEPDTDDNAKPNAPYGDQDAVNGDADSDASP